MARPTSRVSRVLVRGPLAPFTDAYRDRLTERHYTVHSAVNLQRQMAQLSRWLEAEGLGLEQLDEARVEAFVTLRRAGSQGQSALSRPGLRCLLELLRELGAVPMAAHPSPSPTQALMGSFECYLLSERGLTAGTVRGYVDHATRFVIGLAVDDLARVTPALVTAAVLRESASVSVSTAQNFVAALRAFLRFCFVEGLIDIELSQAALPVTGRRRSSLPQGITQAAAAALLGSCDRRTALGRRDYALIVTLLRLGLRRGELANVRLDDIDWRAGELVVVGKGDRRDRLPLPADVGQAIAGYLSRGRPASSYRQVFLQAKAPFEPIAAGTVASTVRRACRRAGVPEVGSHRLRHTLACQMLTEQVPLTQIAQVLRHRSLQSTAIYARVDLDRLRLLAQPWPGGGSR
ncbi:MAG TPA: tyrosine-type recombinase/integrase [Mycobacteriales bacterium]|nr:tyrosine-type recombinase/integrase [Mycobacteriales bacterium]